MKKSVKNYRDLKLANKYLNLIEVFKKFLKLNFETLKNLDFEKKWT